MGTGYSIHIHGQLEIKKRRLKRVRRILEKLNQDKFGDACPGPEANLQEHFEIWAYQLRVGSSKQENLGPRFISGAPDYEARYTWHHELWSLLAPNIVATKEDYVELMDMGGDCSKSRFYFDGEGLIEKHARELWE